MEIDPGLNPKDELARGIYLTLTHRTHVVPTWKGVASTRNLPSAPSFEAARASKGDIVPRQRSPVGLDDEQWSDDLSNPSSR